MEIVFTLDEIKKVAKQALNIIKAQSVCAIQGEMGAGKTTFIHALCEVMGVQDNISSPTFSIINQYLSSSGRVIYHMDLYRIKDEAEAINAGVEDCLFSGNICLVEWPERAPGIFPDDSLYINISVVDNNTRRLSVKRRQQ